MLSALIGGNVHVCLLQSEVNLLSAFNLLDLEHPMEKQRILTIRCIPAISAHRHLCMCCGCGTSSRDLLLLWNRESWWVYAGGLGSEVDRERYWEVVCHALRKFCSQQEEVGVVTIVTVWP